MALICGLAAVGFSAWYFWPAQSKAPAQSNQNKEETPKKDTGVPSVLLTSENDRIVLYNKSDFDISILGSKFYKEPADMNAPDGRARAVPVGAFYYVFTDKLAVWSTQNVGESGELLVPYEIYISAKGRMFTAHFALLIKMRNGAMTIGAQNFDVVPTENVK